MAAKAWKNRRRSSPSCPHEPRWNRKTEKFDAPGLSEFWDTNLRVLCPYGRCSVDVCADCTRIMGGMGPLGCPCDLTRGWNRKYVASMGKPHPPVKAKGRHYDRIRRRERELIKMRRRYPTILLEETA